MSTCPVCGHANSERAKFCEECGTRLEAAAPAREQRKTVTVLFCDVTGSTALGESTDPEALRALLARYFERMKAIVESHGGTVEKFIGDAVMAVFGVPQLHEDDALRAVRAAEEMREALPELGVQARIGVSTGEVVTGTQERLATGDAVNVAARLEQAAQPREVLIGSETLALVRDCVETEALEPLALKGKSEPVAAHRLVAVTGEATRRHEAPMVGRERQRRLLQEAFAAVRDDRSCHLFTILGVAGVGKSRLAAEFLGSVEARAVRGRCLSYGEGITYWPAVEILTQLGTRPEEESAAAAIRSVLGESDEPTTPDEIAWAFRKTLEQAGGGESPLVCVVDDVHWAEPALLDLIEHVADWTRDAPILLLCIARPELLDRRPGWAGGKLNATTVLLEPLSAEETNELIGRLAPVDEALRDRIRESAEGNPLFVEEMLAMVRDAGNGEVAVPPTIQALLAARLDQLDGSERALLERGAVEGKIFHRGAVEALAPEEKQVPQRLMALVRKELVRPDRAQLPGDDAFRFRHLLIRDAAYDALPKSARADLHERFARWLQEHGAALVELEEIVGYHLEQAVRYRVELGQPADPGLNESAAAHLTAAGRKAMVREDYPAALNLLDRAAALTDQGQIDSELEFDRVEAAFFLDMADAERRAHELVERASAVGDSKAELCGLISQEIVLTQRSSEGAVERLEEAATELLAAAAGSDDTFSAYLGHRGFVNVHHMRASFDAEAEAVDQALAAAESLGRMHLQIGLIPPGMAGRLYGSTPIPALFDWLDRQEARGLRHPSLTWARAFGLALVGRVEEARSVSARARRELADRGNKLPLALFTAHHLVEVELQAGDPALGVQYGEEGCRMLEEVGDRGWLATACAMLGECYCRLGRLEEAEALAVRSAELGATDDLANEQQWRALRAKVLARRGQIDEAERLAREALALAEQSDLFPECIALADLGEVLDVSGKLVEAVDTYEKAFERCDRKGMLALAERVHERRDALLLQLQE